VEGEFCELRLDHILRGSPVKLLVSPAACTAPKVTFGHLVGTYAGESKRQQNGGKQMALILFVEHHSAFRQAASYVMDQEPDLAVVAQGGSVAEGRRRMAEGGIDAAIVDIPLPDEGAPEMVRDLYEANPSIPVLVMTALEDSAVHEEMLQAGAAEVLPKEVPFREVLAAVRRLGHQG
jgi:DNA-binding NtrC family response regulator